LQKYLWRIAESSKHTKGRNAARHGESIICAAPPPLLRMRRLINSGGGPVAGMAEPENEERLKQAQQHGNDARRCHRCFARMKKIAETLSA